MNAVFLPIFPMKPQVYAMQRRFACQFRPDEVQYRHAVKAKGENGMEIGEIGRGIAQRRKQLGLSQEELANRLGVTRQAVSKWESGDSPT